jgi:hypothetical protein
MDKRECPIKLWAALYHFRGNFYSIFPELECIEKSEKKRQSIEKVKGRINGLLKFVEEILLPLIENPERIYKLDQMLEEVKPIGPKAMLAAIKNFLQKEQK